MLHLFAGLVYVILDLFVCAPSHLISDASSFGLQYARRRGPSSQDEVWMLRFRNPLFSTKLEIGTERECF